MKYRVLHRYRSEGLGPWQPGDIVDLEPALAEWVNRDSAGTLEPAAEPRAMDAPPADRMVRRPRVARQEPIDRTVFKAVKGK